MAIDLSKPNLIDRIVGYFSPSAALRRVRYRTAISMLTEKRGYSGAARGRRGKNWHSNSNDAEVEVSQSLGILRNRSRDLIRNDPFAKKGILAIVNNTVGTGIIPKVSDPRLNKMFMQWADSRKADFYGRLNLYGLTRLVFNTVVQSGECLIIRKRQADKDFPIQLQVLEPDYLDSTKYDNDDRIRDGVEYDDDGRVVAYWLFQEHPGGRVRIKDRKFNSVRMPAADVIHVYDFDRPGQVRGVPWMSSIMLQLRDLGDYDDAQLLRQKIAACFVGFLKDNQDPITQASTTEEKKPMSERFEPGAWEVLPPGKEMQLAVPPGVGADYDPYIRRNLIKVAAGMGISYEALTGDLSNVNFSSGRMGWIEFQRNIDVWRWMILVPGFLDPVFEWWLDGKIINDPQVSSNTSATCSWTPPRREMIDPVKETEGMKNQVRCGFLTPSGAVRELGYDPDEHFKEFASDMKMLDRLELRLDSDPRTGSSSSMSTVQEEPVPDDEGEEDEESEDSETPGSAEG